MYDVIIIGGGPAGLSAALLLGRSHRSTLLFDAGQPRNAPAAAVHNLFSRDGTPPLELNRIGREQLAAYPSVAVRESPVTGVERLPDGRFTVRHGEGTTAEARRLLFATGIVDELPSIEGLTPLWGRSAFHCPYCHGFEVTGQPIAVLGGSALHARLALHLRRFSDDVALCTNGSGDLDASIRDLLDADSVAVCEAPIARFEGAAGQLERIVFEDGNWLARTAIFVGGTPRQRSQFPEALGCTRFEDGIVEVDEFGQTSVPGAYAAGDMARRAAGPGGAVIMAAASGVVAGSAIDQDLLSTDLGLPSPFATR